MSFYVRKLIAASAVPEGWTSPLLETVAVRGSGHTPDKKVPEYWGGSVMWVSLKDSDKLDQRYISETQDRTTEQGLANSSAVLHPAGTVILSRDAGVGKSAILGADMAVSQHFIAWRCGQQLDNTYLYYWLQFMKPEFERIANGSTILTIGLEYFEKFRLLLPPLGEQRRIAEILGAWDEAIEKVQALIQAKQKLKRGLMQQLLTPTRRFPQFNGQWRKLKLGDVTERVTRKNTTNCTHVLTASGERGLVDQAEYFNRSVAGEDLSGYYLLQRGEFAYNRSSMNGYPYGAIKRLDLYDEGALSTLYICFRVDEEQADSDFMAAMFESGVLNRDLRARVQVGARAHGLLNITVEDFMDLRINLPAREEQQYIAAALNAHTAELDALESVRETLICQKRGLMQKLLTGQVRLKVEAQPDD